jgi:hypothetical protein
MAGARRQACLKLLHAAYDTDHPRVIGPRHAGQTYLGRPDETVIHLIGMWPVVDCTRFLCRDL